MFPVGPEVDVNTSSAIYLNSTDQQAIIRCRGRGYPPPVVSWFSVYGEEIDTNTSSDVHQVYQTRAPEFLEWISTILYVKPDSSLSQFKNYTCNATNLNNQDLEYIEIVRKYPMPAECLNVTVKSEGPQQVLLFHLFIPLLSKKYFIQVHVK